MQLRLTAFSLAPTDSLVSSRCSYVCSFFVVFDRQVRFAVIEAVSHERVAWRAYCACSSELYATLLRRQVDGDCVPPHLDDYQCHW